jgi:hypothetical protein
MTEVIWKKEEEQGMEHTSDTKGNAYIWRHNVGDLDTEELQLNKTEPKW